MQNAITEGFDGYLFAPTAAAAACSMWKRHLEPLDEPTVSLDLPMCDDADYSEGLAATITMQRQAYYNAHVDNALASCTEPCEVAAVGGFVGSDLFGFWENAIQQGIESSRTPRWSPTSRRTSTRAWPWRKSRTRCSRIPKSR